MRNANQSSGIAIGPILFVVAILAVLASAIAAGSGVFNSDVSDVQAKALATAILEYADSVKLGVDRVLAKGCDETQISFENNVVGGYTNPNSPLDKSCHVFDVNGGRIVWKNAPKEVYFDNNVGQFEFRTGIGDISLQGEGTKEHDLFMMIGGSINHVHPGLVAKGKVLLSVCQEINKMLGIESGSGVGGLPKYQSDGPFFIKFTGNFETTLNIFYSAESPMWGKTTLCAANPAYGYFTFIKVLIVR